MSYWKLLNFIFQILSLCSDGQIFKGVSDEQHQSRRLDVPALSINLGKGCQQQFLLVFLITLFKVQKCQEEHSNRQVILLPGSRRLIRNNKKNTKG